jgi:hypothetical protein
MTNPTTALRALLIYAAALPLALLIGYMMATPTDFSTVATLGAVLGFLSIPLVLKWHRPLLFLTWNMTAVLFFLPGRPQIWVFTAFASFGVMIVQKTLISRCRWLKAPMVTAPLLAVICVVLVTANFTGGLGLAAFGSETVGGKAYFWMIAATCGYFAIISQPITFGKENLYAGLFFLGTLSNAIGSSLGVLTPALYYVFLVFPIDAMPGAENPDFISRYYGLSTAAMAGFYYILARYGLRRILAEKLIWPTIGLIMATVVVLGGGYRSFFIPIAGVFVFVYYLEGLVRSRYTLPVAMTGLLVFLAAMPFAEKMPMAIQRSLSILPIKVSPAARLEAERSSEWRIEMWKEVLPEVPKYFWFGKGIAIDKDALEFSQAMRRGTTSQHEGAVLTGAYHNGGLTVLIPFGIWGLLTWIWFLGGSIRALYLNYRHGEARLKQINTVLLALFSVRAVTYFAVFGEFRTDYAMFVGIIALSIAVNGGIRRPQASTHPARSLVLKERQEAGH